MPALADRIDGFQRRHPVIGLPLAVIYKFFEDQGNFLAAMITYYAFIAIFPILLIASSILGFLLQGNQKLERQILDSALSQFPIIGDQLSQPEGLDGNTTAVVVGVIAALYGALGVAQAGQNAMNTAWAVPRNSRPNPFLSRFKSLVLLMTAGVAVITAATLTTFGTDPGLFGVDIQGGFQRLIAAATILLTIFVFIFLFRLASAHEHSLWRAAPGAITVAVFWQLLQQGGAFYVRNVIGEANSVDKTFALVLGLFAFLYLAAVITVLGVEVNVVIAKKLYPRALLTPFTDSIRMTDADRRAYTEHAKAQRHKGFEIIHVVFEKSPKELADEAEPVEESTDEPAEEPVDRPAPVEQSTAEPAPGPVEKPSKKPPVNGHRPPPPRSRPSDGPELSRTKTLDQPGED